jgi:hypothetical protein
VTQHVVPVNDLIRHDLTEDCPCGPDAVPIKRDDGSVGWVIEHHSLDGREAHEGTERGGGMRAGLVMAAFVAGLVCLVAAVVVESWHVAAIGIGLVLGVLWVGYAEDARVRRRHRRGFDG